MDEPAADQAPEPAAMVDPAIRRADLRFVLPAHPATAVVVGTDSPWRMALDLAGIAAPVDSAAPDLAVGDGSSVRDLVALDAPMILLEGRTSTRLLRAAGYAVAGYVVLPDASRPELVLPLRHRAAASYALRRRTAGARRSRRAASWLVSIGAPAAHRAARPAAHITVASKIGPRPRVLADAEHLGVPEDAGWYLQLGRHDQLAERRMALLAFAPGARWPSWVVKQARLLDADDSFERDQRGVDQLWRRASSCAHRAPRPLGAGWTGPFELSVETAAVGDRVTELLRRDGTRRLPLARSIASWLIDLAVESQSDLDGLDAELARLRTEVLPFWADHVDGEALLGALRSVPSVLVHGDAGTWNMVARGLEFSVIDWESARPGLPLWDLLYFLADASTQMARQTGSHHRDQYLIRLFRGEEPQSAFVFEHVRRLAGDLGLEPSAVGALATLCWLHYAAPGVSALDPSIDWYMTRFARQWLADPALGPTWSVWQ